MPPLKYTVSPAKAVENALLNVAQGADIVPELLLLPVGATKYVLAYTPVFRIISNARKLFFMRQTF